MHGALQDPDKDHRLTPDLKAARQFLFLLASPLEIADKDTVPETKHTFFVVGDSEAAKKHVRAESRYGTLQEHASWLTRQNQRGAGVFVCIHEMDESGNRKEANFKRVRTVVADHDNGIPTGNPPCTPTMIVRTSPGKQHVYFVVGDEISKDEYVAVQRWLTDHWGNDKQVKDVTRVMRLPGFYHRKSATPYPVTFEVPGDEPQIYSRATLLRYFPPSPPKTAVPTPSADRLPPLVLPKSSKRYTLEEIADALKHIGADDRSTWVDYGHALKRDFGEEGFDIWDEWSASSPLYNANDSRRRWQGFDVTRQGVTSGSIIASAKSAGWLSTPTDWASGGETSPPRNTRVAQLLSMADVEAKPVEWLWPKRIPKGALSIIAGDPSQGKSQITCYMSATVSTGKAWVDDERKKAREAQSVILLNAEDAAENVIKPRLIAAGADVSRVFTIKSVLRYDDKGNPTETDVSLAQDIQTLDAVLGERADVGLVIIDPISAYLGKVDSHNNSEVRGILAPLARLAEKHNVAIVCVSHLNKGNGGKVTDRVTGSLAFSAAARAVYLVGASPEEGAEDTTKMFVAGKTNLAPNVEALSFKIEGHQVMTSDGPIETSRVQWLEALPMSADDVLRGKDDKRDGRKEGREGLEAFLSKYLADGYWHPFEKIEDAARRAGHDKSKSTFLRAARTIGVEIRRPSVGDAGSEWQLSARH